MDCRSLRNRNNLIFAFWNVFQFLFSRPGTIQHSTYSLLMLYFTNSLCFAQGIWRLLFFSVSDSPFTRVSEKNLSFNKSLVKHTFQKKIKTHLNLMKQMFMKITDMQQNSGNVTNTSFSSVPAIAFPIGSSPANTKHRSILREKCIKGKNTS